MTISSRATILLSILGEFRAEEITVTGVRNEILSRDPSSESLGKASLRRWVNSRFMVLTKKGVLVRHQRDNSKKAFFTVTRELDSMLIECALLVPEVSDKGETHILKHTSKSLCDLKKDLENQRLNALSQMGEIDEYKRIIQMYPDLSQQTKKRFGAAVDHNCRTLGKIKALEEILGIAAHNS